MNGYSFQQVLRQNLSWFCLNTGKRGFILKTTERALGSSKTRDFQNSPPFERSASFHVAISGNFERFFNTLL